MITADSMTDVEDIFKLLTTKERIRLANLLSQTSEISVGDIAEIIDIGQSMTSRFLRDLRNIGYATYRRDAQINYYSMTSEAKEYFKMILTPFQDLPEIKSDNQKIRMGGY